jgi:hypothetical protein
MTAFARRHWPVVLPEGLDEEDGPALMTSMHRKSGRVTGVNAG